MEVHSNNTILNDRTLWYDGDSTFDSERIVEFATQYTLKHIYVDKVTPEIKRFNQMVDVDEKLSVKEICKPLDFEWNLSDDYKELDVIGYVYRLLNDRVVDLPDDAAEARINRTRIELNLYNQLGLLDVLRTLICIINKLEADQIVWGVGRGSSVSSYVLYLIGVHDVDSVEYELNLSDFLSIPE